MSQYNTIKNSNIEMAVCSKSRIVLATKSLLRYHDFEIDRLRREKRLFGEELAKTGDPSQRAELALALRENAEEKNRLDSGWTNSSLRRKLLAGDAMAQSDDSGRDIEMRIAGVPDMSRAQSFGTDLRTKDGKQIKLSGYGALYNSPSVDFGGWDEVIENGAFSKDCLARSDVKCLLNHEASILLGRQKSKSLRVYADAVGLLFFCDLLDGDSLSEMVARRVARRDLPQCSFAFTVKKDQWVFSQKQGGLDRRRILEFQEIFDVSVVLDPAYRATSVNILQEDRAGSGQISDERSASLYARLDAFDERAAARAKNKEREKQYHRLGEMIKKNRAWIAEKKLQGSQPISYEKQQECLAKYYEAGDTIRRLNTQIANGTL